MGHYANLRRLEEEAVRIKKCGEGLDEVLRNLRKIDEVKKEIDENIRVTNVILARNGY